MQDMQVLLVTLRERPDDPESSERLLRACVRYRKAFHTPYTVANDEPPISAREVEAIRWGPLPELDACLDLSCYRLPEDPPEDGCCLWIQVCYIGTDRDDYMAALTKGHFSSGSRNIMLDRLTKGEIPGNIRHRSVPIPDRYSPFPPGHLLWWPTLTQQQNMEIRRAVEEKGDG